MKPCEHSWEPHDMAAGWEVCRSCPETRRPEPSAVGAKCRACGEPGCTNDTGWPAACNDPAPAPDVAKELGKLTTSQWAVVDRLQAESSELKRERDEWQTQAAADRDRYTATANELGDVKRRLERETHLHKLDHSLADQWLERAEAAEARVKKAEADQLDAFERFRKSHVEIQAERNAAEARISRAIEVLKTGVFATSREALAILEGKP